MMPTRDDDDGRPMTVHNAQKNHHLLQALLLVIGLFLLSGCESTGDPQRPIRVLGWHEIAFGHTKFSPAEKVEARCRYRNRGPDGRRTGFPRQCRVESARFPNGINRAMYEWSCIISKCSGLAAQWEAR